MNEKRDGWHFDLGCVTLWPVTYLAVDQEAQGELPRHQADQAQHEGGQQALAGDEGAAARQEGRGQGQQPRGQQRPGHDGELVPGRGQVEVLRDEKRGPGRGQQQAKQHHHQVHRAHAPPQQGVATTATHCDHFSNLRILWGQKWVLSVTKISVSLFVDNHLSNSPSPLDTRDSADCAGVTWVAVTCSPRGGLSHTDTSLRKPHAWVCLYCTALYSGTLYTVQAVPAFHS